MFFPGDRCRQRGKGQNHFTQGKDSLAEKKMMNSRTAPTDFSPKESGINVQDCYQCQKCSAGCPMVFAMDYKPNQIMQMVSLGIKDRVLSSKTI
jgi:heterodisulfide reductase subunit C